MKTIITMNVTRDNGRERIDSIVYAGGKTLLDICARYLSNHPLDTIHTVSFVPRVAVKRRFAK